MTTGSTDRLARALAGRYEIERTLGEGGMATVYLARDLRHGRKVAIKVLRPELAARLGSERFIQEIRVTANLLHPNILPLYESGSADEFLCYVMPYVDGEWTTTGYVVFTDVPLDEDRDIWAVKADGSEAPFPYLDTPFLEKSGDVSPDGRWIAYDSNSPGRFEVFVNSFPNAAASPVLVSRSGGRNPRWSPDGRALFYWNGNELVSARLDFSSAPRVVSRTTLFKASYSAADHANYDVFPDGRRFVVLTGQSRPQRLVVAINPFAPESARP